MRNRPIVVVGGGDSAMQEALTLAQFGSRITLLNRAPALTGQAAYRERVTAETKIDVRNDIIVEEILGDATVTGSASVDVTDAAHLGTSRLRACSSSSACSRTPALLGGRLDAGSERSDFDRQRAADRP